MTTPGALHSDHVNYLVFRYLQEHGHENTARAFWRDWHRPREFRDPEALPFARAVHRHELVSVIQDGLRHDELQSRVARTDRRFRWSLVDPRRSADGDADVEINGSRPSSSGKRKSIGTGVHETTAPAIKRPRLSAPDAQVNGHRDTMDIDGRSSSAEENEDDANAVSPAIASDTGDALAMRYDSVATQTEVANGQRVPPSRLKPRSITADINKQASKIFHAAWSPDRSAKSRNALFVTGESLCRMYRTPDHLDDATKALEHMDEPAVSKDCMVTAMAWHPQGRMLTCAVDTLGVSHEGKQMNTRRIISIGPELHGTYTHFPNSELLQPPGVAIRVEYNPSGDYLMIARTNGNRGLVEIWPALHSQSEDVPLTQPSSWKIFEHSLSDAAWCGDRQVLVCTHTEHVWVLKLPEQFTHTTELAGEAIALHNLAETRIVLPPSGEVDTTYKHDDTHGIDVFFVRPYNQGPAQDQMIIFDASLYDTEAYLKVKKSFELDWTFVTSAVQPAKKTDVEPSEVISNYGPARLLATSTESGGCRMFELNRDSNGIICKPLFSEGGFTLKMSFGPALAVAWSPNGAYLAMAGTNLVQVWHASAPDTIDNRPVLTWRTSRSHLDEVEHVNGIDRDSSKPICLTWDALSEKICFAHENKVTIIELEDAEPTVNGVQMQGIRTVQQGD